MSYWVTSRSGLFFLLEGEGGNAKSLSFLKVQRHEISDLRFFLYIIKPLSHLSYIGYFDFRKISVVNFLSQNIYVRYI